MIHLLITPSQLQDFLNKYQRNFKAWGHKKIKPFTMGECLDFLHHRPGRIFNADTFYTRSTEVRLAIRAIEINVINVIIPDKADADSLAVYQALRQNTVTYRCYGCNAPIIGSMVHRANRCSRLECQTTVLA